MSRYVLLGRNTDWAGFIKWSAIINNAKKRLIDLIDRPRMLILTYVSALGAGKNSGSVSYLESLICS